MNPVQYRLNWRVRGTDLVSATSDFLRLRSKDMEEHTIVFIKRMQTSLEELINVGNTVAVSPGWCVVL